MISTVDVLGLVVIALLMILLLCAAVSVTVWEG